MAQATTEASYEQATYDDVAGVGSQKTAKTHDTGKPAKSKKLAITFESPESWANSDERRARANSERPGPSRASRVSSRASSVKFIISTLRGVRSTWHFSEREEELWNDTFWLNLTLTSLGTVLIAGATFLCWSAMGFGQAMLQWLADNGWLFYPVTAFYVLILFALIPLDFFSPPHLIGCYLRLWETDWFVGRSLFGVSLFSFYLSCLLMASDYPSIPLVVTIALAPFLLFFVRLTLVSRLAAWAAGRRASEVDYDDDDEEPSSPSTTASKGSKTSLSSFGLNRKLERYQKFMGTQASVKAFYISSTISFFSTAIICLVTFIIWVAQGNSYESLEKKQISELKRELTAEEEDTLFIQWAAPLVVTLSNFVFGIFTMTRVFFHQYYVTTGDMESLEEAIGKARIKRARKMRDNLARLSFMVKLLVCAFISLIGLGWAAGQLLYADSQVANMWMGLMGAFFITFIIFVGLSMKRVAKHLMKWIKSLPVLRSIKGILNSDWSRALLVLCGAPVMPVFFGMSMLQHSVRKYRKIYENIPEGGPKMEGWQNMYFTPTFHNAVVEGRTWDWLSIIFKIYLIGICFFAYTVCPVMLNVTLSWFNFQLTQWDPGFEIILVTTFFIGVTAFLLPPVPGLTIYLFGGLMCSSTCPWGFWWGAVVNIGLGWVLKLFACAIQQKCIGGLLGKSLWVRQIVGVHKVAIRCIEAEMRSPGWSLGKVAILCGGPDWPTSVLAGMLDLSLLKCEIGTLPIIFFIIPCALSGSLYLKKGDPSGEWDKMANMMLLTSVAVNLLLWAVAGWAIQQRLEMDYQFVTRPRTEYKDLEWLDHVAKELQTKSGVPWSEVPMILKMFYSIGAGITIIVSHAFWWRYNDCFNHFMVSNHISELKSWYGDEGIVTFYGLIALIIYGIACLCYIPYSSWAYVITYRKKDEVRKELALQEPQWKEDFDKKCKAWTPPSTTRPKDGPKKRVSLDFVEEIIEDKVDQTSAAEPSAASFFLNSSLAASSAREGVEDEPTANPIPETTDVEGGRLQADDRCNAAAQSSSATPVAATAAAPPDTTDGGTTDGGATQGAEGDDGGGGGGGSSPKEKAVSPGDADDVILDERQELHQDARAVASTTVAEGVTTTSDERTTSIPPELGGGGSGGSADSSILGGSNVSAESSILGMRKISGNRGQGAKSQGKQRAKAASSKRVPAPSRRLQPAGRSAGSHRQAGSVRQRSAGTQPPKPTSAADVAESSPAQPLHADDQPDPMICL